MLRSGRGVNWNRLVGFLNFLLVSCFLTPLTVSFWRGTWYILDLFVFPDDKLASAWVTVASGFTGLYSMVCIGDYVKTFLNERRWKKASYLIMFYPLALLVVSSWRGLWMLLDYYTTPSLISACVTHALGFLIVLSTKTTSSIVTPPGYCISERNVDPSEIILERISCFTIKISTFWTAYTCDIATRMLNSFVTVFVIGSGVICYWRGTWIVVTHIKHPDDKVLSSVIAVSLGLAICSVCYCLSEFIATKKLNPSYRLWRVLEEIFVYILGFSAVSVWVGIWLLEDIYLFPDMPLASALVSHSVGIASLYLLQGAINLVGSPAGCRIHHPDKLEGLDMGSYLTREPERVNIADQTSFSSCRKYVQKKLEGDAKTALKRELENEYVRQLLIAGYKMYGSNLEGLERETNL